MDGRDARGTVTVDEALRAFTKLRVERWESGRKARGLDLEDDFKGDPHAELLEELADAVNYLRVGRAGYEPWMFSTLENHLLQAAVLVMGAGK